MIRFISFARSRDYRTLSDRVFRRYKNVRYAQIELLYKLDTNKKQHLARLYHLSYGDVKLACKRAKTARDTFYRWYKEDKHFKEFIDFAKIEAERRRADLSATLEQEKASSLLRQNFVDNQQALATKSDIEFSEDLSEINEAESDRSDSIKEDVSDSTQFHITKSDNIKKDIHQQLDERKQESLRTPPVAYGYSVEEQQQEMDDRWRIG